MGPQKQLRQLPPVPRQARGVLWQTLALAHLMKEVMMMTTATWIYLRVETLRTISAQLPDVLDSLQSHCARIYDCASIHIFPRRTRRGGCSGQYSTYFHRASA